MTATSTEPAPGDVTEHPLVHDVNEEHRDSLSATERFCKRVADWTGAPVALGLAIVLQAIWIPLGIYTKFDPFPFTFLLTCSNVLQLILIFILAVGQRQSSAHAELRAEHDHDSISRLLYHQELQERILIQIATRVECDVEDIKTMVAQLAAQDGTP
ncbi:MAG TPA: DUF1003 domain-containing protein [Candidatus Elarobacter sp.]|jgi:uncharacterized membrane protein|nr:DUF1003 domain-containing protein [Candidatus Elarobacter sp.]